MPKLIDSHSHLNFNTYKDDGPDVIRRALDKNIWIINIGSQYHTSRRALNIAVEYEQGVYAAIGLHPVHLFETQIDEEEIKFNSREEQFDEQKYQKLINADEDKKIVAIGEIGLDYYHIPKNTKTFQEIKKIQKEQFVKQLKFANKNNLPIILHCRGSEKDPLDAYYDLINLIKSEINNLKSEIAGVIHCFGATAEIAQQFIDFGFYIGFTGIITFGKNADSIREVIKSIPLEKILVETDCPYLSPEPHRGKRNEPAYVEFVAHKIAEIKNIEFKKIAEQTVKNTRHLFKI